MLYFSFLEFGTVCYLHLLTVRKSVLKDKSLKTPAVIFEVCLIGGGWKVRKGFNQLCINA
jgi:hypothetical protein